MRLRSAALFVLLAPAPALANPYAALCGDRPCTIHLDASGIEGPTGFIPAGRIAQWFSDSEQRRVNGVGNAVAGAGNLLINSASYAAPLALGSTYVAAPLGLVSGLVRGMFSGFRSGDSAELSFNVVGYDPSGQKITHQFRFVNPKPAGHVRAALLWSAGWRWGRPGHSMHCAWLAPLRGPIPCCLIGSMPSTRLPLLSPIPPQLQPLRQRYGPLASKARNPASSSTGTPRLSALASLLPASSPATT